MGDTLACRLCLQTNIKLFNMFKFRLQSAYFTLTGFEMTSSDGLPPYACVMCSTLLTRSATFKRMCKTSEDLLKFASKQRVLSTDYIQNLNIVSPFSFTIKTNEPIVYTVEQNIEDENEAIWDWDIHDYKVKENESSDEEPLIVKVKKNAILSEVTAVKNEVKSDELQETQDDEDFPNGEVDEIVLSKEQQIEEVQSRQTSMNYLNSFYKCGKCYKGFMTDTTYKNHMIRHDPSSGVYECEVCHIRLAHMRTLRAHVMTSHERKFVCRLCNHTSKSRHRAKEHSKWHSGHTFVCKFCGASFTKSTSHLTHIRLHHPSKHTCYVCGESFIGENGLNMHKKKAHRDIKNLASDSTTRCTRCDVRFHSPAALERHLNDVGDDVCDTDLKPCTQCGESWSTEDELKQHLKAHSKEGQVKCDECNRTFAHERSYAVHYQRVHLRVRRAAGGCKAPRALVVCEVCGRKCLSNASLRYHQRTHTGERPFPCPQCPKRFSIAQRLQIHQRTHTGERPFKCALCPKAFKHKAALNRHDRVHTGAKPYSCAHCGKAFSQSNSMKVHVRTVHLKQPSPYRARRTAVE